MTQQTAGINHDRRTVLKAAGAASVVGLAGCIGDSSGGNGEDEEGGLDPAKDVDIDGIAADPTDVPDPVDWTEPKHHDITLTSETYIAEIEEGATFEYMTFDGQIPGPMIRVREGDTIHLTFDNPEDLNHHPHNVDFHAVYGPGGGATDTLLAPGGGPAEIQFRVEYPGIHIYHCAVTNMDQHISSGMFGAILVEPEEGLPPVDREFYFGQHELYTAGETGEEGHHEFDFDTMADEDPTYVCLNGEAYAYTPDGPYGPVTAEQGETVRVFFANGGPNFTSGLHPIGNVMSRYYRDGDLLSAPDLNVESAPVAPGTVTAWEMETPVPGPIKIVDHALSRVVRKGMMGVIDVQGEPDEDIYNPDP